jgi:hypothetical protein
MPGRSAVFRRGWVRAAPRRKARWIEVAATVGAVTVAGAASIAAPTAQTGAGAAPSTVAGAGTVGAPTIRLSVLAAPSTVAGTAAVGSPSIQLSVLPAPSTVAGTSTVPAVMLVSDTVATPATVQATATVPAATLSAGAMAEPATVDGVTAIGTPALGGSALAGPATVDGTVAIAAVATATGSTVAPDMVTATVTIPGPGIDLGIAVQRAPRLMVFGRARAGGGTVLLTSRLVPEASPSIPAPGTVTGTATVPDVQLDSPAEIMPGTVAAAATIPAATVLGTGSVQRAPKLLVFGRPRAGGGTVLLTSRLVPEAAPSIPAPGTLTGTVNIPAANAYTPKPATPIRMVTRQAQAAALRVATYPVTSLIRPVITLVIITGPSPGTVTAAVTIYGPTLSTANSPATVAGSVTVPVSVIRRGATAVPATAHAAVTVPAAAVVSDTATVTPATVTGVTSIAGVTTGIPAVVAWPHFVSAVRPAGTIRHTGGIAGVRRTI